MVKLTAHIEGIGLLGPGLEGWASSADILQGRSPYTARPTVVPVPEGLPAAERRRVGLVVKLALGVGLQAVSKVRTQSDALPAVFASSGGDGQNCHEICQALANDERMISPTRFHNSVHNAAAGYWSIATRSKAASNALCAFDWSFAAGLLEAVTQVVVDQTRVLLVAYDAPYPQPLLAKRPIPDAFGVAFVLAPRGVAKTRGGASAAAGVAAAVSACAAASTGQAAGTGADAVAGAVASAGTETTALAGAGASSGMVGAAAAGGALATVTLQLADATADRMSDAGLEALRTSIPAARALPLLQQLATQKAGLINIEYLDGRSLAVEVEPCS